METTRDYSGKHRKSINTLFDQIILLFDVKVATVTINL
jgi:hypothetical protein